MIGWVNLVAAVALVSAPVDLQSLVSLAGQHAAAQEKALENVAITTTSTQQELNGSGSVKHSSEIVSTATPVDGHKKYEIVKAFEDGHDISQEESKKMRMAQEGADKPGEGRIDNPFLPSEQGKYHFWRVGPDPKHPGWTVVGFGPTGTADVNLVAGQASVDGDGYVRHVEQRPSKLPSHMTEISMTLDYATPSPWGPLRTEMKVQGKGTIFYFLHRAVRGDLKFSYALPSGAADAGTAVGGGAGAPATSAPAADAGT